MIAFLATMFFASAYARSAGISGMITPPHSIKPPAPKPSPPKPSQEEALKKEIAQLKSELAKSKDYRGLAKAVYGSYVAKIKDDVVAQLKKDIAGDVVIDGEKYASFVEKVGDDKRVTLVCYATGDEIEATVHKDGKVTVDSVQLNLDPAPFKKRPAADKPPAEKAAAEKVPEKKPAAEKAPESKPAEAKAPVKAAA